MCGVARRRSVVLLLGAWIACGGGLAAAGLSPTTRPAAVDGLVLSQGSELPENRLTLLNGGDAMFDSPATTQPVIADAPPAGATRSIYDPLPPALWSGLSVLVLTAAVLSLRRAKTQLR